jgi:SpoIID/LytB domain protein
MSLNVSIGLLWDEPQIRGELICDHEVICMTDCCRSLKFDKIAGHFEARASASEPNESFGVRLAESLTKEHAERTLAFVGDLTANEDLLILEAGRQWETASGTLDNRVWWPTVRVNSPEHAANVMEILRTRHELNALGFTVVKLSEAKPTEYFEFTLGDFSAKVLEVRTRPLNDVSVCWLYDVPIGRGFHWEHKEQLEYRGELKLFQPQGHDLTAVNILPLEMYLESAVGSEMRSDLPPAFSQAQAIAARSTVLATAGRHHRADGFDLCNDDHCQCYQGTQREANAVISPIRESAGKVLVSSSRVVDARYAKSCGGVSELYEEAWGDEGPNYFAVRACGEFPVPDLTDEDHARAFVLSHPPAWCNDKLFSYPEPWDKDPLFRWRRETSCVELGELIASKTGTNVGAIQTLHVKRRGSSGRILILEVMGSDNTLVIYGELNIRRALSPSHLPSSFFVVDIHDDTITLTGGGWGHGVGLCQLGAAAMAKAGKSVEQILDHYYPKSELQTL